MYQQGNDSYVELAAELVSAFHHNGFLALVPWENGTPQYDGLELGLLSPRFVPTSDPRATALPVPTVPLGTDPHFQTENRVVWNDEKQANEVHQFVYEVSWIPELGAWRRFLRAHRRVASP